MKIYKANCEGHINIDEPIVACIGYFDGLHLGHQELIEKAKKIAYEKGAKSALITFYPDPKDIITKKKHRHIQNFTDRLKIAQEMGIDIAIVYDFTQEMCKMPEDVFYQKVLCSLPLVGLVCGFDFSYGYKGEGTPQKLKDHIAGKYPLSIIDEVLYQGEKISSTRVRIAIEKGDIELANELLGYPYFNRGKVIHGKRNGHKLGYPTANIRLDDEILCPRTGVYIGFVKYADKIYKAMCNIGNNPTIAIDNGITYEVHIIDFDGDIYDQEITVYLKKRIRDDKRFDSLDELKEQLAKDKEIAERQSEDERLIS